MKPRASTFARLFWLAACFLSLPDSSKAKIVYVNGALPASGTGLSWAQAKKTIPEAQDSAEVGDEIWVAQGTYPTATGLFLRRGVSLVGGFAVDETNRDHRNFKLHRSILDGQGTAKNVVRMGFGIMNQWQYTSVTLDGFVITGGNANGAPGSPWNDFYGGGIWMNGAGNSRILNCTIVNNSADSGGGLYALNTGGIISNCEFIDNRASQNGGGIYTAFSTLRLTEVTVCGNRTQGDGGGVIHYGATYSVWRDCFISGNRANGNGAGVYASTAPYQYGIGFPSEPLFQNCVFSGNVTPDNGGAIFGMGATLRLSNVTIDGNSASRGGGVYVESYPLSQLITTNTLFSNNQSAAIYATYPPAFPSAIPNNCLFFKNSMADYAAGDITYTGAAQINSSVPGARENRDGDPAFLSSSPRSWTLNPFYDSVSGLTTFYDTQANFVPDSLAGKLIQVNMSLPRQAYIAGNSAVSIAVYGDYFGGTSAGDKYSMIDYRMALSSAAIDHGANVANIFTDIDGKPRPVDIPGIGASGSATFDIGAYETPRPNGNATEPMWTLYF